MIYEFLCTPPAPFRQLQHRAAEHFPRRQCCQQGVTFSDPHGAADLLGDDDPAQVVDAPHDSGCFHLYLYPPVVKFVSNRIYYPQKRDFYAEGRILEKGREDCGWVMETPGTSR